MAFRTISTSQGRQAILAATDLAGATSLRARYVYWSGHGANHNPYFGFRDDPAYLFLDNAVAKALPEPGYFMATGFGLVVLLAAQKRRLA